MEERNGKKKRKNANDGADESTRDCRKVSEIPWIKKESAKSQGRQTIEKIWPSAFGMRPTESPDVIFEDLIQALKSVGQGTCDPSLVDPPCSIRNGRELVMCMKKSAEQALRETNCHTCVICFDRYDKVPKTKGVEESHRDEKKQATTPGDGGEEGKKKRKSSAKDARPVSVKDPNPEDGIGFKDRRPYLTLDGPLPRDWSAAMKDRDDTLPHIVRWMCAHWLGLGDTDVFFFHS